MNSLLLNIRKTIYFLAWPALLIYLRIGARTRVLMIAERKILLVQTWLGDGSWGLPGGGLHHKELELTGAIREVREETGIRILSTKAVHLIGSEWRRERGLKFYCHFFVVKMPKALPIKRQEYELAAAEWVPLKDLKTLRLKPEVRRALELADKN